MKVECCSFLYSTVEREDKSKAVKKVPKGTSEYQASWIIDSEEEEESGDEKDGSDADDDDDDDDSILCDMRDDSDSDASMVCFYKIELLQLEEM